MDKLTPFRVHFMDPDLPPYDTVADKAQTARKRAEETRPGEPIRKIKVLRENADG